MTNHKNEDLIRRLRADHINIWQPLMDAAADAIEALTVRAEKAEAALSEAESINWRIAPNMHTIPSDHPLGKREADPFEGPGETWEAAYHRVSALLATAFEVAANIAVDMGVRYDGRTVHYHIPDSVKPHIRALAPADAQAALDARINAAREEGRIMGLREGAEIAKNRHEAWTDDSGVSCDVTACAEIAATILNAVVKGELK